MGFDIAFGIPDFQWDPRHGQLLLKKVTRSRDIVNQEIVEDEQFLDFEPCSDEKKQKFY